MSLRRGGFGVSFCHSLSILPRKDELSSCCSVDFPQGANPSEPCAKHSSNTAKPLPALTEEEFGPAWLGFCTLQALSHPGCVQTSLCVYGITFVTLMMCSKALGLRLSPRMGQEGSPVPHCRNVGFGIGDPAADRLCHPMWLLSVCLWLPCSACGTIFTLSSQSVLYFQQ